MLTILAALQSFDGYLQIPKISFIVLQLYVPRLFITQEMPTGRYKCAHMIIQNVVERFNNRLQFYFLEIIIWFKKLTIYVFNYFQVVANNNIDRKMKTVFSCKYLYIGMHQKLSFIFKIYANLLKKD